MNFDFEILKGDCIWYSIYAVKIVYLLQNAHLAELGLSLGGVITLLQHPASMTHGPKIKTDAERAEAGIIDGVVRIR